MKKKKMLSILQYLVPLFILVILLNTIGGLYEYTEKNSCKKKWEGFYSKDRNSIDLLILGNSHAACGINPSIIEERLGLSSYNLATSSQDISQTYYFLKEALKYQDIKYLIIDSSMLLYHPIEKNRTIYYASSDYMRFSINKLSMVNDLFSGKDKIYALLPFTRGRLALHDPELLSSNYRYFKRGYQQKTYKGFSPIANYLDETRNAQYKTVAYDEIKFISPEVDNIENQYLSKIKDLCRENGVTLKFITVPMLENFNNRVQYDKNYDEVSQVLEKSEISFTDFNMNNDFNRFEFGNDVIGNNQHLNYKGAEKFTDILCDTLSGVTGLAKKATTHNSAPINVQTKVKSSLIESCETIIHPVTKGIIVAELHIAADDSTIDKKFVLILYLENEESIKIPFACIKSYKIEDNTYIFAQRIDDIRGEIIRAEVSSLD